MAPPNSSGKDERLPASLFTVYQTYKRGTSIVIGWLIAADTGSPKDHRTTDNAASTDTVTVKQLLESAQKASHEKRVPPNTVHDAFKIVLVNHTRLTRYYESLSSISSETKASTVCHKVFNETLAQAYNILFAKPKTSKRSQKKKISTASEANPPISSNSFEALSAVIEQEVDFELTASQFWDSEITQTTEPPTILNDTIADAVAMHTFVGELQTFVTKIKEIWKSAASGELPLAVAGWLTNVGHRYLLLWEEYSPQHSNLWKDQTGWSLVSQGRWIGPDEDFICQHRVSSFKLTDPTKPGYVGFIALYLVDSTANIPPQQMDSYIDSLLGTDRKTKEESTAKLLPDLVQLLVDKGATGITDDRQGRLPRKLWNWVGDGFEEDDHMLPLTQEGRPFKQSLLECVLAFAKAGHKGKL
ncbi:DUF4246 domain containing protein [Pyrenophora tritici-repentis]|nr:DUF4246 domain-containing protein [Pyrenophora tritici-repentis]PZD35272.1 DUF4246 domain containing protein [Pyrenophora tritici-repentis]